MNSHQCYLYIRGERISLTITMIQEFVIVTAFLSVSSSYAYNSYTSKDSTVRPLFNDKFEEVYRWKQLSFVPLDDGRCIFNRIVLFCFFFVALISNEKKYSDTIHFGLSDRRFNDLTASEIQDNFIQYNNMPMGAMRHKDRIFITLPRRRPGMPATLTYVRSSGARKSSPGLQAYPNFRTNELHVSVIKRLSMEMFLNEILFFGFVPFSLKKPQNQPDSKRIVSVYRSRVDSCNRLWFVDTGKYFPHILYFNRWL